MLELRPSFQTFSEVLPCQGCDWQAWSMFCISLQSTGRSTCAATGGWRWKCSNRPRGLKSERVQRPNVSLLQVFVEEVWLQDTQDRAGGDWTVPRFGLEEDAFGLGRLVQVGPQKAKGPQGKSALPVVENPNQRLSIPAEGARGQPFPSSVGCCSETVVEYPG